MSTGWPISSRTCCWVNLDLGCSTVLLGQHRSCSTAQRPVEHPNQSQPNPGPRGDRSPCRRGNRALPTQSRLPRSGFWPLSAIFFPLLYISVLQQPATEILNSFQAFALRLAQMSSFYPSFSSHTEEYYKTAKKCPPGKRKSLPSNIAGKHRYTAHSIKPSRPTNKSPNFKPLYNIMMSLP